jgi:hypothetical protein
LLFAAANSAIVPSCKHKEPPLSILQLDRLAAAPLHHDPFDFVLVENFLASDSLSGLVDDFPRLPRGGSFPAAGLAVGPHFARLLEALEGRQLRAAIAEKFAITLEGKPTMVTLRGWSDGGDGFIHTDSRSKLITLLLYLNPVWEAKEGRLRLLRGPQDLEDYALEVAPLAGTMLAFRRSDHSFHGHLGHRGERRVLQLNWVRDKRVVRRELARHRWSARGKALAEALQGFRGRLS